MPTSRTIADIKSKLLHPALTSHFEVTIPKPPGLSNIYLSQNGVRYDQDKLNLLCSEAVLPGSQLTTHDITGDFHGSTHRHAYRRVFDDVLALTFYVDAENYLPIRYFETWIKYIAGEQVVSTEPGRPGVKSGAYFYRMNYPQGQASGTFKGGYICEQGLSVTKFERSSIGDVKGKKAGTMTYQFVNAFPTSVNSMAVSYDASSLLKCSVNLSYVRYFIDPAAPSTDAAPAASQALTAQQLANINNIAFNPNTNLGIAPLTTGGVPFPSAQASGNNVKTAFSGVSLI